VNASSKPEAVARALEDWSCKESYVAGVIVIISILQMKEVRYRKNNASNWRWTDWRETVLQLG
jgi:hypothetical protein